MKTYSIICKSLTELHLRKMIGQSKANRNLIFHLRHDQNIRCSNVLESIVSLWWSKHEWSHIFLTRQNEVTFRI